MIQILLEVGILFLLLYLPLAAGGVTGVSLMLLAFWCTGLFLLWLATGIDTSQLFLRRRRKQRRSSQDIRRSWRSIQQKQRYAVHVTFVPGTLIFGLFLMLAGIQLMPLPTGLVKLISPFTFQLYADAATQTGNPIPTWIPLSIATQSTETEFYKLIAYGLFFIVLVNILRTISQIRRLVYSILIIGIVEAFYGFSQISQSRISGSFVNHNHFAGYLGMVIPLTFGLLLAQLESRNQVTRRLLFRIADEKYLKTLLLIGFLTILISALFLSGSRGGFVSLSLAVTGMCALLFLRRLFRKWIWGIVGLMGLMLGLGVLTQPEAILQRFGALTNPQQDLAFLSRLDVWRDSMRLFADVPVIGTGLGTFAHIFRRYQTFPSAVVFTHAENDYIQLLTETGIIGSGIVLWACIAFGLSAFRAWRQQHSRWAIAMGIGGFSALLSMGIHSGSDFNLHIPSNAMLFTAIMALTYAVVHLQSPDSQTADETEESAKKRVVSPHERYFIGSPFLIGGVGTGIMVLIGVYCTFIGRTYWASAANRVFRENIAIARNYPVTTGLETLTRTEYQAIRLDPNHADYYFSLGSFLYRYALSLERETFLEFSELHLQEAEVLMKQAIMRDPANSWYYYELGGVSLVLDSQGSMAELEDEENKEETSPSEAGYFLAALENAPTDFFLQTHIGRWLYKNAPEIFPLFVSTIRLYDNDLVPLADSSDIRVHLPEVLYLLHLDFQSDQELIKSSSVVDSPCQFCESSSTDCPYLLQSTQNADKIELGNDDGIPEWSADLMTLTDRIKKVICLPENLDEYTEAALKVFMSNGGNDMFDTYIYVDDHLVKHYDHNAPRVTQWYDIALDRNILNGKSRITVYFRVVGASDNGNFLRVRGDADTPTTHSYLNFDTASDLSSAEGIQTGEYMIRLVLRKE